MSEVEKQESQKTVVAFITGLLIGGLLVWVFSSTPETKEAPVEETAKTIETTQTEVKADTTKVDAGAKIVVGKGSIVALDQKAGNKVTLGAATFPTKDGWVVVRDYMDGVPGNVLGAARYGVEEGLIPTSVELIRNTLVGNSYQVTFYVSGGATGFKSGEDTPIDGAVATFKAN